MSTKQRRPRPLWPTLGLIFALCGAAWHAVQAQAAEPRGPIRIGMSASESGSPDFLQAFVASYGGPPSHHAAVCYAASQILEQAVVKVGSLDRAAIRDDGSSADTAKKLYAEFIERDRLDFVFGPYSGEITAAVAPLVDKRGYPMLSAGGTSDEIWKQGYRHVFAMSPPANRYSLGFLALLADAKLKSLAVVSLDDTFSLTTAEGTRRWAERYGLQVTLYQVLPRSDLQLEPALQAARRSGAQALVLAAYLEEAGQTRTILKRIGWSPMAYFAAVGPSVQQYHDLLGPDADHTFSPSLWEPRTDLRYPDSTKFFAQRLFIARPGPWRSVARDGG